MAEARETRVFYKTLVDASNLKKELRQIRTELAKTQAAESAHNAQSAKERAAATKASTTRAKALSAENANLKLVLAQLTKYRERQRSVTSSVVAANKVINAQNRALSTNTKNLTAAAVAAKDYASAQRSISRATGVSSDAIRIQRELTKAQKEGTESTRAKTQALKDEAAAALEADKANIKFVNGVGLVNKSTGEVVQAVENGARRLPVWRRAFNSLSDSMVRFRGEGSSLAPVLARIERGGNRLYKSLERFGNWRPRLVPPFVALIPIIGAVIAAINPLVALLGAVGGAAIGLAGQIGSLAGAFVALPGILSGVVAGIAGVIASMGGVGNVFKTYSAMQKAIGKSPGTGGESQAERADRLADSERNLARAQRNVQKAQENLNKAREEALRDLINLRQEVSRASLTEERAIADLRLAQEAYWNVMADPGSTLGDKLDAAARIKEAEAELDDVRKRNIENQKALTEAERKGVDQSEKVLDAQENLADAYEAQKDAQRALNTEAAGGSAAVTAINDYNEALAALSPSARKFVLAILAMEDQWKSFRREMQETFFSQFTDDLDRLPRLLDTITRFLRPAAAAMGQFVDHTLDLLDSPAWKRDLASIGDSNAVVITNLGNAFLSLSSFLKDVVVAAIPFTEWMTGSFAEGADNMSKLLDTEDERGSFREWLEKVADRLSRWWQIVKNIGGTIFNYSAAASSFGDWITDGLLEMTANWLKFSEEARDPNSGFQQWLEDIKPVLEEVDRLFGAFFGWFAREAADPENIQSAVDILKILTDDVGPALGRLFDTLASTDIDEKFLQALASIIESVDTIMESGGSAAFETFFDIVEGFFEGLSTAIAAIPKPILEGLLSLFGFLAAATFIGKFTGLTNLLGLVLGLTPATAGLWGGIFSKIKGLDKLKFASLIGKGGLLALLAAGVTSNIQSFGGIFDSLGKAAQATEEGRTEDALGNLTENGTLAKGLLGPLINFGSISEVIGWFSPEAKADLDKNLEGISGQMITWFTGLRAQLILFGTDLTTNWNGFWGDVGRNWAGFSANFKMGWDTFWGGIKVGWDSFWGEVQSGFQNVVNGLGTIWAGVQNAFRGPANWVITNVWNNGIRRFWNDTAGKLGLGTLGEAALIPEAQAPGRAAGGGRGNLFRKAGGTIDGVTPGYTPGSDVHHFVDQRGNQLHLSGGEGIMRPEFVKLMGGKAGIDALNSAARNNHFARGGLIGDWGKSGGPRQSSKTPTNPKGGTPQRKADVGGDLIGRIFTDPVGYALDGLNSIINPLMGQIGNDSWSGMMKAIPGKLVSGMVNTVKTWFAANPAGGGGGANAIGWQRQWAAVKNAFPGARLNSAYRPGAITSTGSKSYHGQGRAIDVTPSMEIFNWIRQNYPNSRELIYSPAGNRQLQNGQNRFWGEPVRSQHWDHVHWAMKNGGVFDQGGWMQPGQAGFNFSNKPEAVLTNEESLGLKKLLAGTGLSGSSRAMLGSSVASSVASGPQMVDNSIRVERLIMNNPVPEKPSTSLPKAIRQIGYMNMARTGQDPA